MNRIIRIILTFVGAFIFFSIIGFFLSITIPLLLGALPPNAAPVVGPPVRVLEKILPGGVTMYGALKNLAWAAAGTLIRELRAEG